MYNSGVVCNIDQRGRRVRRAIGIVLIVAAIALAGWEVSGIAGGIGWWVYILAVMSLTGGMFALYEARKGWCAVRAMGIRTPI